MQKLHLRGSPRSRESSKGAETRIRILEAARDIFIEHGYHGFTMRRIAGRSGLSLGNLVYHYKTKDLLLNDLLDAVIDGYEQIFIDIVGDRTLSAKRKLVDIIELIVVDLGTRETTHFFPELWALANHNAHAASGLDLLYRRVRNQIVKVVMEVNPQLTRSQCELLALFISASLEGHTMFVGHRRKSSKSRKQIAKLASSTFVQMVEEASFPLS